MTKVKMTEKHYEIEKYSNELMFFLYYIVGCQGVIQLGGMVPGYSV